MSKETRVLVLVLKKKPKSLAWFFGLAFFQDAPTPTHVPLVFFFLFFFSRWRHSVVTVAVAAGAAARLRNRRLRRRRRRRGTNDRSRHLHLAQEIAGRLLTSARALRVGGGHERAKFRVEDLHLRGVGVRSQCDECDVR